MNPRETDVKFVQVDFY